MPTSLPSPISPPNAPPLLTPEPIHEQKGGKLGGRRVYFTSSTDLSSLSHSAKQLLLSPLLSVLCGAALTYRALYSLAAGSVSVVRCTLIDRLQGKADRATDYREHFEAALESLATAPLCLITVPLPLYGGEMAMKLCRALAPREELSDRQQPQIAALENRANTPPESEPPPSALSRTSILSLQIIPALAGGITLLGLFCLSAYTPLVATHTAPNQQPPPIDKGNLPSPLPQITVNNTSTPIPTPPSTPSPLWVLEMSFYGTVIAYSIGYVCLELYNYFHRDEEPLSTPTDTSTLNAAGGGEKAMKRAYIRNELLVLLPRSNQNSEEGLDRGIAALAIELRDALLNAHSSQAASSNRETPLSTQEPVEGNSTANALTNSLQSLELYAALQSRSDELQKAQADKLNKTQAEQCEEEVRDLKYLIDCILDIASKKEQIAKNETEGAENLNYRYRAANEAFEAYARRLDRN